MSKRLALTLILLTLILPASAQAARTLVGTFGAWQAYTANEAGALICYMGSEPTKQEGKYSKRGQVVMLVTHRPKDKETGVISVTAGYAFKKDTPAKAVIGDQVFEMFTSGEHAFVEEGRDPDLIKAMIRGADIVVTGTSSRGTLTTDTYSLKGFTAAWKAIGKACKI